MEFNFEKRAIYVQSNTEYYMNKFNMMETTGGKVSWNWCAFLFGSFWLIYRKMYKEFAIVAALEIFLIPAAASLLEPLGSLSIVLSILVGLYGNFLYMNHIDQLIAKEPIGDSIALADYQSQNSGTTYYVWIYLGVASVIRMLLPFGN